MYSDYDSDQNDYGDYGHPDDYYSEYGDYEEDNLRTPPFFDACFKGELEKIKHFLLSSNGGSFYIRDQQANTALHKAVQGNKPEAVKLLMKLSSECQWKIDANAKNIHEETALHVALRDSMAIDCAEDLIINCDVDMKNQMGETPLMLAVSQSDFEDYRQKSKLMDALLKASKMKYTVKDARNYFEMAIIHGNVYAMETFIQKVPDLLFEVDEDGNHGIHLAAINGQNRIIESFMKYRVVNISKAGHGGSTPLHFAADMCQISTIEFLVTNKANCNAIDENGNTPLHAVLKQCFSCCKSAKCRFLDRLQEWKPIRGFYRRLPDKFKNKCALIAVATYLYVDGKADIFLKNKQRLMPFEMISEDNPDRSAVQWYLQTIIGGFRRVEVLKYFNTESGQQRSELKRKNGKAQEELLRLKNNEMEQMKREIDDLRRSVKKRDNEISKLQEMIEVLESRETRKRNNCLSEG